MRSNPVVATTLFSVFALAGSLSLNTFAFSVPADDNVSEAMTRCAVEEVESSSQTVRPGTVTLRASSTAPFASGGFDVGGIDTKAIVAAVSRQLAAAKNDYSPKYGERTSAVREKLVDEIRNYVKYSATPGHEDAKALVKKLQFETLIKLSEESPVLFRSRLASAVDGLSSYARSSQKNVEKEKSLAVSMEYYLAVFEAATRSEEADDVDSEELEREKRELFNLYCDELDRAVREYFAGQGDGSLNSIVSALGEMRYYQSESPSVVRLTNYLHGVFGGQNIFIEASERFLSTYTYRDLTENFGVNENIRGTHAQGAGVLRGGTYIDLRPCETRAEMLIALVANVSTRTIGANRGVFVHTDNLGSVSASKPIYLNPNGIISTTAAVANANMKTTVRGINTERLMPFGGLVIQNKVSQELPESERAGASRIGARVAQDLDAQANTQILEMNRRVENMAIGSSSSMIHNLSSRTTDDRLYLSCVLGRNMQFSVPRADLEEALNELRRQNAPEKYVAAETSARSSQLLVNSGRLRNVRDRAVAAVAPNLQGNSVTSISSNTPLPRLDSLKNLRLGALERRRAERSEPDLVVRFHQTAPNNAAMIALADAVFGPGYDSLDNVLFRFPGVDPADVKEFLTPYMHNGARELDPEDHAEKIFVRFDAVQPFATTFENDTISTFLRISSCDVDGKEWGPIEVRLVYRLERRGDEFVFVRDEIEVLPGGYQEGDPVSARFYTFRRIFIKRLEATLNDEYTVSPTPVDTIAASERRGALVPKKVEARNGWFHIEFQLVTNYGEKDKAVESAALLHSLLR